MSTPEKFFHINPALKPGAISRSDDDHLKVHRPHEPPQSNKDFREILDKSDNKPTKDTNDIAKDAPEEKDRVALKDPTLSKVEKLETFVKETTQPGLDPRFNQAPTLDKDSKIAPKLGKEITVAPAEEPRAMGFIEDMPKERGKVTLPGEKLAEKGKTEVETDNIVKAMPAEKQPIKLPRERQSGKPDNLLAQAKQAGDLASAIKEEAPKTPDQLFSSMAEKSKQVLGGTGKFKEGEEGFSKQSGQEGQSGVNLMTGQGPQQGLTNAAARVQASPAPQQTHQLIQQIADQLSVVSTDAKSDTTITLKNIPQFEGVRVIVTTYPTARGEINVTFENLTQEGKLILDMVDNRAALKQALDQKGFIVHMIVTTTVTIERTYAEGSGAQKEGRGEDKDEKAGGGGGQHKQDQDQDA
jgi:hypothetical protein